MITEKMWMTRRARHRRRGRAEITAKKADRVKLSQTAGVIWERLSRPDQSRDAHTAAEVAVEHVPQVWPYLNEEVSLYRAEHGTSRRSDATQCRVGRVDRAR